MSYKEACRASVQFDFVAQSRSGVFLRTLELRIMIHSSRPFALRATSVLTMY
jgi:hypothetical protein